MSRNWMKISMAGLGLICIAGWMPVAVAGAMKVKATEKVEDAGEVMRTIMDSPDKSIPKDLLRQSAGVAIFPGVIKGGFFIGGKYGKGVVMRHNPKTGRWSPPAFYSIAAASYGLQFGGQSTDLVLVIMNNQGMKGIIKSEFTLGADASVAAGPVGRKAQANVDVEFKSAIYSYSRSRGVFIGISLEGSKLNSLIEYNEGYYGKALTPRQIIFKGKARAPKSALTLMANMRHYAK